MMMPAREMIAGAGQRGERGQGVQRDVHPEGAGAVAPVLDAIEKGRRQRIRRQQPRVQQFRIDAGGDIFGADGLAIVEDDADGAVALDDHLAHAGIGFDLDAMPARGARHRLRDRAHAADGVAPDALLAVHLAEGMVQHHIGRARGVGAGVIADDGVEPVQRLDQIALEPVVQHLAGRTREQIEQAALLLQRKPAQDVGGAERIEGFADGADAKTLDDVRRRAQHEGAQHVGDLFEFAVERVDPSGVALAEFRHGLMGAAFAGQEIAAVGGGQEILRAALDDPQAVLGQLQVGDDLRVEQADGVGRDRIAETRMEFLGDRGAADHLAALDHLHAQPGHRQIGRAGEAVMPRADDDNVGFVHVRFRRNSSSRWIVWKRHSGMVR